MPEPPPLTAEQAVDRVVRHLRKRIQAIEGVRLEGNAPAIHELKNILDLLERCRNYIREVSSKLPRT